MRQSTEWCRSKASAAAQTVSYQTAWHRCQFSTLHQARTERMVFMKITKVVGIAFYLVESLCNEWKNVGRKINQIQMFTKNNEIDFMRKCEENCPAHFAHCTMEQYINSCHFSRKLEDSSGPEDLFCDCICWTWRPFSTQYIKRWKPAGIEVKEVLYYIKIVAEPERAQCLVEHDRSENNYAVLVHFHVIRIFLVRSYDHEELENFRQLIILI